MSHHARKTLPTSAAILVSMQVFILVLVLIVYQLLDIPYVCLAKLESFN